MPTAVLGPGGGASRFSTEVLRLAMIIPVWANRVPCPRTPPSLTSHPKPFFKLAHRAGNIRMIFSTRERGTVMTIWAILHVSWVWPPRSRYLHLHGDSSLPPPVGPDSPATANDPVGRAQLQTPPPRLHPPPLATLISSACPRLPVPAWCPPAWQGLPTSRNRPRGVST